LLCVLIPAARAATISATVSYEEVGGPKDESQGSPIGDLFTITNDSDVGEIAAVFISLSAGLLFDTDYLTDTAGTAPAFPFTAIGVDPILVSGSVVPDGSDALALTFQNFGPGKSFVFQIDVDRTGQQNDNQNRHVIGHVFEAAFSVEFVGLFPESPVTASGGFDGHGQTANGTVTTSVVPEPAAFPLVGSALATLLVLWLASSKLATSAGARIQHSTDGIPHRRRALLVASFPNPFWCMLVNERDPENQGLLE
jgi:hypothetical protein